MQPIIHTYHNKSIESQTKLQNQKQYHTHYTLNKSLRPNCANHKRKRHNTIVFPDFWELGQRKQQTVQGGSNHALDAMLESKMQNRETQSDG